MVYMKAAKQAFVKQRASGIFWDPARPGRKIGATLQIGRHGRVKLATSRADVEAGRFPLERSGLAHGRLSDGRLVTLWADANTNFVFGTGEKRHQRWDSALIGGHIGDEDSTTFRSSTVAFDGIDMWTRTGPIRYDAPRFEYGPGTLVDVYKEGIDVTVSIENAAVYETLEDGSEMFRRFLGEDGRIRFDLPGDGSLLSLHRRLWFDLRALVTFATQQAGHLFDFHLITDDGTILQLFEHRPGSPLSNPTHATKMLISPAQCEPSELFPRWWDAVDALYPVPQILVGKHYSHRSFLEQETLAGVAAAETLHGILKLGDERFTRAFFRPRRKAIKEFVATLDRTDESEDFDKFIGEVLDNRKTFRTRLQELGNYASTKQLRAAQIDVSTWVEVVGKVRNSLAHTGSHVKSRSGAETDLLRLADHGTRAVLSLAIRKQLTDSDLSPKHARTILLDPRWILLPKPPDDDENAPPAQPAD